MLQIGKELSSGRYDVLIVGGGITGIAIAREAAERGLSVCLVEKNDFGGATSASTSKLIHGGLRYLENFEIGLVRESLAERRILGLAASHLVKPLPFMIPVLPWSKPGKLILRTGLYMYDALSYDRNRDVPEGHQIPGSVSLSEREVQAVDPMIASIAKGALLYYDYQSLHPERLTLAFLKSALQKGAVFYNHTEATGFIVEEAGGRRNLQGAEVRDTITGKTATIRAGITINASGPWMDLVLGLADRKSETKLSRSTGIHFLTKPLFKHNNAVLFRTRSGRHFFVVPWEGFSLIGPTDRPYTKHPDELRPGQDDFDQLFEDINDTLPGAPLTRDMIVDIPIGIRPLIFSGKSTYKASRRYEILDHESKGLHGLISVAGGKWTTSRQLGEDVMTLALSKLPDPGNVMNVNTGELPLFGSPGFGNPDDIYIDFSLKNFSTEGISPEVHRHLISMYGTEHTRILEYVHKKKALAKPVSDRFPTKDIMAQVLFSVEHEGARTVSDIIRRRIALGTYGLPTEKELLAVAQLAAPLLKWNQTEVRRQVKEALAEYPTELMGGKAQGPAGSRTTAKKSARTAAKKAVKKSVKKTAKKAARKTGKKTSKKAARR
ncbi:glycerol-3-phosphate dehydrogenase/oxidase [Leptonema illini]|uniref:FAD dependent oxidoreductase n=1 Tax=Leptonema illini DSM 21528 TaxID=929563 RepID=H2CBC6_9LEPT|nr:glycerol-3-phosphate dehydrogenase/oxidase [Leptonema illini]EHQ06297.1 FAD dependent oxidoreductase [Leptonema illini DSM 21528]